MAVVDTPWDGSPGRFTDEQYQRSCALDRKSCGGEWADKPPKTRCSLPYKEPDGAINKSGVHAAAGRIGAVTGACSAALSAAKSKLRGAYSTIGEPVPDSLKEDGAKAALLDDMEEYDRTYGVIPGVARHEQLGIRGVMPFEVRSENGAGSTMFGHFAVFRTWTEIDSFWEGRFLECIAPGAFKKTFDENLKGMRSLFQHGRDPQIGMKPLGKIDTVGEDDRGAAYEVSLFTDAGYVRELMPALEADQLGASFRFQVIREEVNAKPERSDYNPEGIEERTITECKVREFGPVTFGAYEDATAGIRCRSLVNELFATEHSLDPDFLRAVLLDRYQLHTYTSNGSVDSREGTAEPSEGEGGEGQTETAPSDTAPSRDRLTQSSSAARSPLRTSGNLEVPPWKL